MKNRLVAALVSVVAAATALTTSSDAEAGISINWDKLCINAGGFVTDQTGPTVKPMMNGLGCDLAKRAASCPRHKSLSMETLKCSIDQEDACTQAGGFVGMPGQGYYSVDINQGTCMYPVYPCKQWGGEIEESMFTYTAPSGEQFGLKRYTCSKPINISEKEKFTAYALGLNHASNATAPAAGPDHTATVEHQQDLCAIKAMQTGENYVLHPSFGCIKAQAPDLSRPEVSYDSFGCEVGNYCNSAAAYKTWDPYMKSTNWVSMGAKCPKPGSPGCFQ